QRETEGGAVFQSGPVYPLHGFDSRRLHPEKPSNLKVGSARVFRCEGWTGPLIVSEEIKDVMESSAALVEHRARRTGELGAAAR
ncbi:MAG: hypothetical protein JXB05_12215, partial [Myxococcaceae bacterium]|nr:hypothetical protein [Myxococcaceae bacterium]